MRPAERALSTTRPQLPFSARRVQLSSDALAQPEDVRATIEQEATMVLYEFITSSKNAILERARSKVMARTFPPSTANELESGLPLFLTQLAETLRLRGTPKPFSPTAIGTSAGKHGLDLLEQGWTIAQVVHDYGDICQAVTEAAVERRLNIRSEDFQTLNLCLDNAIAAAVTEFSRERDDQTVSHGEAERLGRLTHELRNLLSTAMLSYEAVTSGRVPIGGSTGAILGRSLSGLRDLIDTTISEVRMSAGTHQATRLSLASLLHEVEGAASLHARQREVAMSFTFPPADLLINADRQLLSSALLNLLQNAFKFTVPHGRVAVRTVAGDEKVFIEVEDECGGLPEKNAEVYFAPFTERRGRSRAGLGLGLSISRKAVRACGGDIHVRNLPGKGCIFVIELPTADHQGRDASPEGRPREESEDAAPSP
jgi:signal transduction histidine kinase